MYADRRIVGVHQGFICENLRERIDCCMTEPLQEWLKTAGFGADELAHLLPLFRRKEFRKGDFFLMNGQTNQHLGWVESGLFQYFYNHDGSEITTYITGAHSFVASLSSLMRQQPAYENIRAITDAYLWTIPWREVANLKQNHVNFLRFYADLIEYQLVCVEESRFVLLTLTAEERYQKLLREEPHLLQQIPLQYLAAMLGVTPRHLSRIRRSAIGK